MTTRVTVAASRKRLL